MRHPGLVHGVFSRQGGVSPSPYAGLNVSYNVGDTRQNIRQNRALVKDVLQFSRLVSANQIHGDRVFLLEDYPHADCEVDGCDALITRSTGTLLMIQQADCQAVFLFDRTQNAIGLIHAGWRGSVADIIGKTITAMQESLGCKPANIIAAISPSLGPCCAEFINYEQELPESLHKYQAHPFHFDFWAISRDQLIRAGLSSEHITAAGTCTRCTPDYFSYRREEITGRFASVIGLN